MKPRGAKEVALSLEQALKARDQNTIKDSPLFKFGWQRGKAEALAPAPAPAPTPAC